MAGGLFLGATAAHAGTSTLQNPTVIFSTPGVKQVTLNACNGAACNQLTQQLTVLDPMPAISSAAPLLTTAEVGQLVRLTGAAGGGKPPLTLTWSVTSPPTSLLLTLPGGDVYWDTSGLSPGLYLVSLTASNSAGSVSSLPALVTLAAAQPEDLYTIVPCRVYDSRAVSPLISGVSRTIAITGGACGIPANARAIAVNTTVIVPTGSGFVTLYPGNYPQPTVSMLTFATGAVRSNFSIVPLATDASGNLNASIFVGNSGIGDVTLDVSGYFLPGPTVP